MLSGFQIRHTLHLSCSAFQFFQVNLILGELEYIKTCDRWGGEIEFPNIVKMGPSSMDLGHGILIEYPRNERGKLQIKWRE